MKTICFYFQIHQPFRLKRYRFFDIGNAITITMISRMRRLSIV